MLWTFSGREGVLGALGAYRAVFNTMAQTTPTAKVQVPVALGGEYAIGANVREMVELVAENVSGHVVDDAQLKKGAELAEKYRVEPTPPS